MRTDHLTQARLRKLLSYDPRTGLFVWLESRGAARAGDVAGSPREGGYIVIRVDGTLYRAHQLVFLYMAGEWVEGLPDHKNGNRTDNRWRNLRPATYGMNAQNRIDKPTTGVECRQSGTFRAQIKMGRKKVHIGTFATHDEAKAAYLKAKASLHPGYLQTREKFPESPQ